MDDDPRRKGREQGESRSKIIILQNHEQAFREYQQAMVNPWYSYVTLLCQSKETCNFRRGMEYVVLNQRENVMWYDNTLMEVTTAIDHVNGRPFMLYKVSFVDLMQRWIPELTLATNRTLCPKVYGFIFKKREGQYFLLLKYPEQGGESLQRFLLRNEDMDIIREVTHQIFAKIHLYHTLGVANLGITVDSVYVIRENFNIEFGGLSRAMFQGFDPGFDEAKLWDVILARNIILSYMNRIPIRSPLCFVLENPSSTALDVMYGILRIKPTQETSYDLATDEPGFLDDPPRYPRGLCTGEHRLFLVNEENRDADSQAGASEQGIVDMQRPSPPGPGPQAKDISLPSTNSKCLAVCPPVVENEESPQARGGEELILDQGSDESTDIGTTTQPEQISYEAVDFIGDQGEPEDEQTPGATSRLTQTTADSGMMSALTADREDDEDGDIPSEYLR